MGSFNPLREGDWQGLNIMLEKLFFTSSAEARAKNVTKKTGPVTPGKTVTIGDVSNTDKIPIIGVDDDSGISLYADDTSEENITIPDTGIIYRTNAGISIPSSYFLDLRGIYYSSTSQQYTADVLVVHNAVGDTLTLTSVDEINDISIAGPKAGGRDQASPFGDCVWVHVYIIYNPYTGDVSSVSSSSATNPTLPTGYTFFCRVGAIYVYDSGVGTVIVPSYQMGDKVMLNTSWVKWNQHSSGWKEVDLSMCVPPTAKLVHGVMGLSSGDYAKKMKVSATSSGTITVGALCDASGTGDTAYGVSGAKDFTLPLLTQQTIWWFTETTGNAYAIGITGFTDDL